MPTYAYRCDFCGDEHDEWRPIAARDEYKPCGYCATDAPAVLQPLRRLLAAPMGRIAGRVIQGGGADRFTADMLGVPLKELPAGLRTPQETHRL